MAVATNPPRPDTPTLVHTILSGLYLAEQLDQLHLSIINLLDMVQDEEIALVLDQEEKTTKQKRLFVDKIVRMVRSPELRELMANALKNNDFQFFQEKELGPVLHTLQEAASQIVVVRVSVAIEFKPEDVREMATLLSKKIGSQAVVSLKVEHGLVGGAIIQYGSYMSDYSVKSQLELFRSRWHRAVTDLQ